MILANPHLLWLLVIPAALIAWYVWKQRTLFPSIGVSSALPFSFTRRKTWKAALRHVVFAMVILAIVCEIIMLARPQKRDSWSRSSTEGTDIIIALDISTSMLARDFRPDRFEAAKSVATRFVSGREGDNMGLVIFAGESFTAVPMTTDRSMLANYIHDLRMGMINDGTAIGDGLATAINRIREGKAKSKSIILLTDGTNNMGNVAPVTAAEIASKNGIKVYTIGVGTNGNAPYPQVDYDGRITYTNQPVVIDEPSLKQIAELTGGKYFRATNNSVLNEIFQEIDALEKTQMDVSTFSAMEDDYMPWAIAALALFAGALIIRLTVLRSIPS